MSIGVRTCNLQKVYTTPPPSQAGGLDEPRGSGTGRKRPPVRVLALDNLSLEISPGEIFGLLGPNGAGKSTTIGILTTRIRPSGGEAWIGDLNVSTDRVAVKRVIGVVPQQPNLDFALTAREVLTFHGAYFGLDARERGRRADFLLEKLHLTERANQIPLGFSGGMKQRLSIARALMHAPQVLFLDEPSAGLDPQTRLLLWEMIRECNSQGTTILLTTHNMDEADRLSHRVAIIDHGQVIAMGPPEDLKRSVPGGYLLKLQFSRMDNALIGQLRNLPGVTEVRSAKDDTVQLYADRGGPIVPLVIQRSSAVGVDVLDVHISEPSLENLFLHHTGRSLRE